MAIRKARCLIIGAYFSIKRSRSFWETLRGRAFRETLRGCAFFFFEVVVAFWVKGIP
jgi:hypothetical protein